MRGLVFALLAAAFVASVQSHRYRGPRFINLGITGILPPVYAGYNRGTLSRFGSISGSSLSRTFDSSFLASGVTGGQSIGLSSVYPLTRRSTTIRTVAPFSGGFQSYNEFGGLPSVPSDGLYDLDGPLTGFGPGGSDLGPLGSFGPLSGDSGVGPLDGFGPNNDLGPLGSFGPLSGDSGVGPLDGFGPNNDLGPEVGPGPYDGIGPDVGPGPYDGIGPDVGSGPYDGIGPDVGPGPYDYLGPRNGLGPLGGDGPFGGDGPLSGDLQGDGLLTGRLGDLGPLGGGRISGGYYGPLGYDYEASLGRSGAGSVYESYRGLDGSSSLYPNPFAGFEGRFDLGDRFSSSGDYDYLYNYRPGVSGFDGDVSVSGGGPGLDFNLQGGGGQGFSTQFSALEGQGSLGRGTGSAGLADSLGSPGRYLEYNNNVLQ